MPAAVRDPARFTLAQLKERGDRAIVRAQETMEHHEALLRDTRELHSEIDRLHHTPKIGRD